MGAVMNGMAVQRPAARRRHVLRVQRLHAAGGAPRRPVAGTRSSSSGRTTRSASARTARPTSPSSTSRRCGRCPGCAVIRPADANETAPGLARAHRRRRARRRSILTRQRLPVLEGTAERAREGVAAGRYVLVDETGDEPRPGARRHRVRGRRSASTAAEQLAERGLSVRVVSMPSWDLFADAVDDVPGRGAARRRADARRRGRARPSAGSARPTTPSGIDHFGASAPGSAVLDEVRLHPENVADRARELLAERRN